MLNNLSSNTGQNAVNQIEKARIDDIYDCINNLEERINANCAQGQCLQEQINAINDNPTIIKDEGQFDNVYADCLNVTNPIVAPGVDGDFTIAGDLIANDGTFRGDLDVCGCFNIDNLSADTATICHGNINVECLSSDCVDADNLNTNIATITSANICCVNSNCVASDSATFDNVIVNCNLSADTIDGNAASISSVCANGIETVGATISCGNITEADLKTYFKNSAQVGNQFIAVPVDALGETADFYRYQIAPNFSGEVNLWNCDFSINILVNNTNNILIGYRTEDPTKIRSFYKDNQNCKFYIETTSTENICWSYRSADQKCYNFSENYLIEACTTAGAVYVPNCVYIDIEHSNSKDHYYLLGDNTTQSGLSICGTLAATYLAFEQAYFPDLTVDNLTVNSSAEFKGGMVVGSESCPANICQYGNHELDNIHVRCCSCLGDTLSPYTTYTLSTYWEDRDYYTYDGIDYTYVGRINEDAWEANKYYIRHDYQMSCNILCGCNMLIGGATVTCGQLCADCFHVVDWFQSDCVTNLCGNTTISGNTYIDGGSDNCSLIIDTCVVANCDASISGSLDVGGSLEVTCCTNLGSCLAVNDCATFSCDVSISGDLFVNGTMHIVDEETINAEGDIITLRTNNPTALTGNQVSGFMVNKYNGTNDLTVAADCTGTLRVGTAAGTTTCYPDICYNDSTREWTAGGVVVTPVGELTSWCTKEEIDPFTHYTDAIFTQIDITTMEPIATREEDSNMSHQALTQWNGCCTRIETINNPTASGQFLCANVDPDTGISYGWGTAGMPAGVTIPFAGSVAPSGWLLACGQCVSRTTYSNLFAVIGTTYGAGDGENTFQLPDMSNRTIMGANSSVASETLGKCEASRNKYETSNTSCVGNHQHNMLHIHNRGDMEILGDGLLARTYPFNLSGAFAEEPGYSGNNYFNSGTIPGVKFQASRNWTGNTSWPTVYNHNTGQWVANCQDTWPAGAHCHSVTIGNSTLTDGVPNNIRMNWIISTGGQ